MEPNPFRPVAAKIAWLFRWYLSTKSNGWEIFEEELFIKPLSSSLLQIVEQVDASFPSNLKSMTGPDNIIQKIWQKDMSM